MRLYILMIVAIYPLGLILEQYKVYLGRHCFVEET